MTERVDISTLRRNGLSDTLNGLALREDLVEAAYARKSFGRRANGTE